MPEPRSSAGDILQQHCLIIEIRVAELRRLFNAIDPSPFRQRDLDPRVEEFIVDWARDLDVEKPWALVVHLDRPAGRADEAATLREAIHQYFGQRAVASRRRLRELFRRGRLSLVIALVFLTASIAAGDVIASSLGDGRLGEIVREGFLIGGWVAMWRPLEVFLYDWWPIRAEGRLLRRLSTIPVRIEYTQAAPADAWRADWPEVSAGDDLRSAITALRARSTVRTRGEQWQQSRQGMITPLRKSAGFGKPHSTKRSPTRFRRVILPHLIPIPMIIQRLNVSVQPIPNQNV